MDEALCSILTGENEWVFHSEGKSIKFNKDGTGEVCTVLFAESLTPPPPMPPICYGC